MKAVRLVARRELIERIRTRAYQVSTAIGVLMVVAGIALPALLDRPSVHRVGVVGPATPEVREPIAALSALLGGSTRVVEFAGLPAAESALRREDVEVVLAPGREVVVKRAPRPGDAPRLASALSLGPAFRAALPIRGLEAGHADRDGRRLVAFYGSILIFMFLSFYGYWILNGVVEEKTSRVVEVLLAAVRPGQLLAGKVIGIGIAALTQALAVAAAALGTQAVIGTSLFRGSSPVQVLSILGWFALAFALYGGLYAAAGAMINRQEEAQNMAFPIQLPLVVGYIATISSFSGDDSAFLRALSLIPLTAPVTMPTRIGGGAAASWEVALSVALMIVSIVAVARVGGGVYARSILRTGSRVRLRDVLRSARA